jgi:hypothetical protein
MILSLMFIALIALSGQAVTYLFIDDKGFMRRLAAGNIIGAAIFGLAGFILASFFGLTIATVLIALAVTLVPIALYKNKERRNALWLDWQRAKGKFDGANFQKMLRFAYYLFFFLLFWFFFERAMLETDRGILTGASQNLGDLPYHLGAIFGFTDGQNFPPQNPSFSGARFSYPFIADFITACVMKLGVDVRTAMLVTNVSWAFSLLVLLEGLVSRMTGNKLAGRIAPFLLFFSGGLGFLWFFSDYFGQAKSLWEFIWNLPRDYTIGDKFRWGNSMVTLFITQRSLLLGMPLTLIVLGYLWKVFSREKEFNRDEGDERDKLKLSVPRSPFIVGLLAGTLPLIHLHSLAVLFIVGVFLFILKPEKWREWTAFGVGAGIMAVPELWWSMAGSANRATEFFGWHFGWDSGEANFFKFWLKNTGIVIPVLIGGMAAAYISLREREEVKAKGGEKESPDDIDLLLFYLPFAFCFVVSNVAKLAPWEWDNIKVLIYWFVGSIPFISLAIARAWEYGKAAGGRKSEKSSNQQRYGPVLKVAAGGCLVVLTLSGALDVWRTVSGQINNDVFDQNAVKIATRIKLATPPNALFLNAPTYNSAIVLTGRRSLMRYIGHLMSHGIDYREREADLNRIYEGGATADIFLRKYGIDYVLISPLERQAQAFTVNEEYFKKYTVVAESGPYKVYKVK